ncbi:hypothetical protein GCM10009127_13550 [Alteraurantiacibacter aestuarii]|uniref:LysM domain-containing protein n=1 Tax=Alteraurantiacibacter aestuarii TaxID=650004 RepID=A0A844ZKG7_9SPHN|nr:hypothetical protein [Alteraurantiacibacter aestuarii]MXO88054.1 hypothetical protein [Alteraurantiacibacter aestuarii]
MFDPSSRYHGLPNRLHRRSDGREYVYKARRLIRDDAAVPASHEVTVGADERLDTIAARELGDPLAFWRIADANPTLDPFALVEPGTTLKIPSLDHDCAQVDE